jgi:predicted ferric reductase
MATNSTENFALRRNRKRLFSIIALVLAVAVILLAAASIAFLFESPSIMYKFGWDKVMLRAAKVIGLMAAVLLLLQVPLAGRFKFLDRIFSLPGLCKMHRINGYIILLLIAIHPFLVTIPEDRLMIPFEGRYWPEWIGAALLVAVLIQIGLSRWRNKFIKAYQRWLFVHRLLGWSILTLLVIHILYVSETFEFEGLPRTAIIIIAMAMAIVWFVIRGQRLLTKKHPFEVSRVASAGKDAQTLELKPVNGKNLEYLPGQFAFFSFKSRQLSAEWHPFTLSSSPTRPNNLQITVRSCGDWTDQVKTIQTGDRVLVHGPFGRFSHVLEPDSKEVIMIAGGIGITPMLSMLRALADNNDQRKITLLWSNRSAEYEFNSDELLTFSGNMPSFNYHPVFTDKQESKGEYGRLNLDKLKPLLSDSSRDALIFLCGPPPMIHAVRRYLISLGFAAGNIKEELFGL